MLVAKKRKQMKQTNPEVEKQLQHLSNLKLLLEQTKEELKDTKALLEFKRTQL